MENKGRFYDVALIFANWNRQIKPNNISAMESNPGQKGFISIELWDFP